MMSLRNACAGATLALVAGGAASADEVTKWQSVYQEAVRIAGGAPGPASRVGSMVSLAMYDAINAIDAVNNFASSYQPYQTGLATPDGFASREAAAASAARGALLDHFGGNATIANMVENEYQNSLNAIANGAAKTAGIAYGAQVATSLIAQRLTDGFDNPTIYTYGGNPGDFRVTPDGPNLPAFSPTWGQCTPWGLQSGSQFRPTRLTNYGSMANLLASQEYADNVNEVKSLGARNSATRTAEQTEIAWFWANDRNGTYKPPGHLVEISKVVSTNESLSLSENARMFALVNMAIADACMAAWDVKYDTDIDLWRPIDAVRETLDDGNALTISDPTWVPLNDFTPPFPAYVSGHGTMGAAHAGIMAALFGDQYTFTVGSDEFGVNPGIGYPAGLTRTFDSFSQAAMENALSRIYLGVHYRFDAIDANTLGYDVAEYIFANYLQQVPSPSTLTLVPLAVACLGSRRRR